MELSSLLVTLMAAAVLTVGVAPSGTRSTRIERPLTQQRPLSHPLVGRAAVAAAWCPGLTPNRR